MILRRGPGRGSFLWGRYLHFTLTYYCSFSNTPHLNTSSTHNTRIERVWREGGTQCVRRWRGFFSRLEKFHGAQRDNSSHIWLIQFLFLDAINEDLDKFTLWWNLHPVSGAQMQNRSPSVSQFNHSEADLIIIIKDMRFATFSMSYPLNEEPDIHPDILALYPPMSQGSNMDLLVRQIERSQESCIRHEPIEVTVNCSPFENEDTYALFIDVFSHLRDTNYCAPNLLINDEEWGADGYPSMETIYGGARGKKAFHLHLPVQIWRPRAILWSQAFVAMCHVLALTD